MSVIDITIVETGSSGNATVIDKDGFKICIDNGIAMKKLPADIKTFIVSHEHVDHISGMQKYCKKYGISIMSDKSFILPESINMDSVKEISYLEGAFLVGDMKIKPIGMFHDVPTWAFLVEDRYLHITDTGRLPSGMLLDMISVLPISHIFIEANYDEDLLECSLYGEALKKRISGGIGHLSTQKTLKFLQRAFGCSDTLECAYLGHLSKNNNRPDLVDTRINEFNLTGKVKVAELNENFSIRY